MMDTPGKDGTATDPTTGTPPAPAQRKKGPPAPADATPPTRKRARKRRPRFVL
jgi:hypothetical protein